MKSRLTGVYCSKTRNRWIAQRPIQVPGKKKSKIFKTQSEAEKCRLEWNKEYNYYCSKSSKSLESFIRACFSYKDGELYWKVNTGRKRQGDLAGYYDNLGYKVVKYKRKNFKCHRVIWFLHYGEWPKITDHINQDRADNRIENLRNVTTLENARNQTKSIRNTSGVTGVYWHRRHNKWYSSIHRERLYYGDDFFEACCARKSAELKYGYHSNHGKDLDTNNKGEQD